MKCSDVNTIIILALILTIIGDSLGLLAELLNQRCTKKEEAKAEKEKKLCSQESKI
jgi:hypothetical protein